jgi:spore coat polysaccharide biosynthesis protein SpsF (cytidylyltransferase family)
MKKSQTGKKEQKKRVTACIIQARMTSKRFPGKTMAILDGKPVLAHVVDRAIAIPGVDKVVVAFPEDEASLPILNLCREKRVIAFAGDEDDVLLRYYEAAKHVDANIIMRITADCPLIFPPLCGDVLEMLKRENLDYAANMYPDRSFPRGYDCEVFTFDCLEAANMYATTSDDREHVTPWMQRTTDLHRGNVINKEDDSELNYCVDFPEDIGRIEAMIKVKNG